MVWDKCGLRVRLSRIMTVIPRDLPLGQIPFINGGLFFAFRLVPHNYRDPRPPVNNTHSLSTDGPWTSFRFFPSPLPKASLQTTLLPLPLSFTIASRNQDMAQIRGTAGYNLGNQNPFSGPGRAEATNDPSPLDAIREQTSKIEDWLDTISDPIRPYVPALFS